MIAHTQSSDVEAQPEDMFVAILKNENRISFILRQQGLEFDLLRRLA